MSLSPTLNALVRAHLACVFLRRARTLVQAVARHLPESGRVLDVGCGNGQIAALLQTQRPGLQILGLEVRVRPDCRIACRAYDGRHLPFEDASFDAGLLVDVLHHTSNQEPLIREGARVCRTLIVKDHLGNSAWQVAHLRFMDWFGNAGYGVSLECHYPSEAGWRRLFDRANLQLAAWETSLPLYPFPFSLLFGRGLHFMAVLHSTGKEQTRRGHNKRP